VPWELCGEAHNSIEIIEHRRSIVTLGRKSIEAKRKPFLTSKNWLMGVKEN